MDANELQDDSLYNKDNSTRVNGSQEDGFLSMGAQTGAIKLAMAGT